MSRNFGWGSRDMKDAGRMALESNNTGFSSIATHSQRFGKFKSFCKENGVGRLERVTPDLLREYGRELANKVDGGELSAAYAQNLVSSVNSVMKSATRGSWKSVSPTQECGIPERNNIRTKPTPERELSQKAIEEMKYQGLDRQAAVAALALNLGLRSKEASLLNAEKAFNQALKNGCVSIKDGTKGGREREIHITTERQIQTLKSAAAAQNAARAVMPPDMNWKVWEKVGLVSCREALKSHTGGAIHNLRSAYAAERYQSLTGHLAPCNGGKIENREIDKLARLQIAQELGHGRITVLNSYIGK